MNHNDFPSNRLKRLLYPPRLTFPPLQTAHPHFSPQRIFFSIFTTLHHPSTPIPLPLSHIQILISGQYPPLPLYQSTKNIQSYNSRAQSFVQTRCSNFDSSRAKEAQAQAQGTAHV